MFNINICLKSKNLLILNQNVRKYNSSSLLSSSSSLGQKRTYTTFTFQPSNVTINSTPKQKLVSTSSIFDQYRVNNNSSLSQNDIRANLIFNQLCESYTKKYHIYRYPDNTAVNEATTIVSGLVSKVHDTELQSEISYKSKRMLIYLQYMLGDYPKAIELINSLNNENDPLLSLLYFKTLAMDGKSDNTSLDQLIKSLEIDPYLVLNETTDGLIRLSSEIPPEYAEKFKNTLNSINPDSIYNNTVSMEKYQFLKSVVLLVYEKDRPDVLDQARNLENQFYKLKPTLSALEICQCLYSMLNAFEKVNYAIGLKMAINEILLLRNPSQNIVLQTKQLNSMILHRDHLDIAVKKEFLADHRHQSQFIPIIESALEGNYEKALYQLNKVPLDVMFNEMDKSMMHELDILVYLPYTELSVKLKGMIFSVADDPKYFSILHQIHSCNDSDQLYNIFKDNYEDLYHFIDFYMNESSFPKHFKTFLLFQLVLTRMEPKETKRKMLKERLQPLFYLISQFQLTMGDVFKSKSIKDVNMNHLEILLSSVQNSRAKYKLLGEMAFNHPETRINSVSYFERMIELPLSQDFPYRPEHFYMVAQKTMLDLQHTKAIEIVKKSFEIFPNNHMLRYTLACYIFIANTASFPVVTNIYQIEEALEAVTDPNFSFLVTFLKSILQFSKGDTEGALSLMEETKRVATEESATNPNAQKTVFEKIAYMQSYYHYRLGDYSKTLECLNSYQTDDVDIQLRKHEIQLILGTTPLPKLLEDIDNIITILNSNNNILTNNDLLSNLQIGYMRKTSELKADAMFQKGMVLKKLHRNDEAYPLLLQASQTLLKGLHGKIEKISYFYNAALSGSQYFLKEFPHMKITLKQGMQVDKEFLMDSDDSITITAKKTEYMAYLLAISNIEGTNEFSKNVMGNTLRDFELVLRANQSFKVENIYDQTSTNETIINNIKLLISKFSNLFLKLLK
ncbi:hypothetical protein DLAC_04247 [Tieghemostelium lacteum]|uniref:Uncharacterized protein n=1 Tax=Tieghemostelium lacteum TaxID=361077 RepID=A0A151ZSF6_TIELA|nr:hypothetical protein DLAC_04247 [Tieghemostelium lacteum]|eukprot:KYQ96927.1 hypothetical protein DLAC_04247 [Tieghemostelium lacteum]